MRLPSTIRQATAATRPVSLDTVKIHLGEECILIREKYHDHRLDHIYL